MSEELIRRSDAIDAVMNTEPVFAVDSLEPYQKTKDVVEALEAIPTIEPKRGEWETVFMSEATGWDVSIAGRDPIYGHRCSICKEETFVNDVGEEMLTNFCPNCGADMRGADDE